VADKETNQDGVKRSRMKDWLDLGIAATVRNADAG
jgi:hypothetical protein